jgi:hypothetical protein
VVNNYKKVFVAVQKYCIHVTVIYEFGVEINPVWNFGKNSPEVFFSG